MKAKFLSVSSLALLQIVIVANLQPLSANAVYGLSLPFFYVLALVGFFIPSIYMVSHLATQYPQTGGAYIWVQNAFGKKWGFFTATLLWVSNLLWYPSIFTFIASNAAYVIHPQWASHKIFIISASAGLFWFITLLNCLGIKISARLSIISAVLGIIFPMLLIIACGGYWIFSGHALAISLKSTPLIPNITHMDNLGFLIGVTVCFFGIEIPAVHAGNVEHPEKSFPKSLWISGLVITLLTLLSTLAIACIVPTHKLSVVTGILDAIALFFNAFHWKTLLSILFFFILLGNLGSIMAWMLGSTRGMFVASLQNHVSPFLQKTNRHEAPVGVLIFEAVLYTLAASVFLLFPHVADSFWLLLVVASQITLLYYIVLFYTAIRLIPGSVWKYGLMGLGALTSIVSLVFGFIPPPDLTAAQTVLFHAVLAGGLIFAVVLPKVLLRLHD